MSGSSEVDAAPRDEQLERRAAALRQQLDAQEAPARELAAIEAELAAKAADNLQDAAERRVLGIVRAIGSLAANAAQDDVRLLAAAVAYEQAMTTLNERFLKIRTLAHEAAALVEAFGLPAPDFPATTVPCQRGVVAQAQGVVAQAQPRESFFISPNLDRDNKRTYDEVEGEGAALITRRLGVG